MLCMSSLQTLKTLNGDELYMYYRFGEPNIDENTNLAFVCSMHFLSKNK
jgi:hypothetical protein